MIVFRHADPRYPFLWEDGVDQPSCRWKAPLAREPVHCFTDTSDGAWAEFLRHEEITDPGDLDGIERDLWAIELLDVPTHLVSLSDVILLGDKSTYPACQAEVEQLKHAGVSAFVAPSAALLPGAGKGWIVDGGLQPGPPRDGKVFVLLGSRPDLVGWCAARRGRPREDLIASVRHF